MTEIMPAQIQDIDYDSVMRVQPAAEPNEVAAYLMATLPDHWCDSYDAISGRPTNIVQVKDEGFVFLFDLATELVRDGVITNADDRVVVAYGRSIKPAHQRDAVRMAGFLRDPNSIFRRKQMDKGHFLAHSSGGGLDINLFPQKRSLNRGWSREGRLFRSMESFVAKNPGTFFFSRPIYHDQSWRPVKLEFGVLRSAAELWVETFDNW